MNIVSGNSKKAILWLCLAHLICDIYGGFLNPLMPFIAEKLNFTMTIATILIAFSQICSNMLQPIFGFFADNILKRFFIFWGLILSSMFIPFSPSTTNILTLTIFMTLGCLGSSFFHPQAMGFINFFSGKNCSKNMGLFVSLGSLGFAIGPLIATYIAQSAGLNKIIYTSFLGIFCAFLMFQFVPKLSLQYPKPQNKNFINSFKTIFHNKQINYLMIIAMMKSLITNSFCILLPFLWKSMNYTPFYIGLSLFLFVFAGAIGSLLSPIIENKLGSKPIIYFSMFGTFPLIVIFALTYKTLPIFSMIDFALIGFVTMLAQPVILVWAQKVLPEYKSIISGFINGFCWGIIALITSILGFVAENIGIIKVLIILSIIPIFATYYIKFLKENNY